MGIKGGGEELCQMAPITSIKEAVDGRRTSEVALIIDGGGRRPRREVEGAAEEAAGGSFGLRQVLSFEDRADFGNDFFQNFF